MTNQLSGSLILMGKDRGMDEPEKAVIWRNRSNGWSWAFVTPLHTDKHGRAYWKWLARLMVLRAASRTSVEIECLD
jgi:hypothetical protein